MAKMKSFQISDALTRGLEETVSVAHNYSGQLRIEALQIKKIDIDFANPRELSIEFADLLNEIDKHDVLYEKKQQEINSLASMVESIKREGVINPVVVYKEGERYKLIAGERRTLASILAKKEDIPAKILDKKPSELKLSMIQWIENIERADLTLWERLKNLEKIVFSYEEEKKEKMAPTALSELLGCVLSHAVKYHAILHADEMIKEAVKEGKIKNLDKAAIIVSIKDEDLRLEALNACVAGATLQDLKNLIVRNKKLEMAKKEKADKLPEGRGRQTTRVNLGTTKNTKAVKFIIDSIITNKGFEVLKGQVDKLNWGDYKSVSGIFQKILKTLETNLNKEQELK